MADTQETVRYRTVLSSIRRLHLAGPPPGRSGRLTDLRIPWDPGRQMPDQREHSPSDALASVTAGPRLLQLAQNWPGKGIEAGPEDLQPRDRSAHDVPPWVGLARPSGRSSVEIHSIDVWERLPSRTDERF